MIGLINKFSLLIFLWKILINIENVMGSLNYSQKPYIYYHIDQECSKRVMAEYILRENECNEYNKRNKQKILQSIITSQLIVNKQKLELNNLSEILELAEQFKPLEESTKNQILVMKNVNGVNLTNKFKNKIDNNDIKMAGVNKNESMEQSIEETIRKNSQQLIEEEVYFAQQQELNKKYELHFTNQLENLQSQANKGLQQEINNDSKINLLEDQMNYYDQDNYNNNELTEKLQMDPNFWKQQLQLLEESNILERKRFDIACSSIQKEIDILQNLLNSLRSQNDKQQDIQELSDLMNILDSMDFDLEPLKQIQNVYEQQQQQQGQ